MLRALQWDLARQLERRDWLLAQLPRYADWGFHELYLHLEDAVDYPGLPGVGRRGAWSMRDLGKLTEAAGRVGIHVVPIVNLLGHTQYLIKVPAMRDLNELRAADGSPLAQGQICPVHPRTPEIADRLLRDVAPFCTAGKVHVGLDESFQLGRHPLSRRDIGRRGHAGHFAAYVGRLHGLARERGLRLGLWADMLYFLPHAIPLLPRDVIAYDWYYYPFRRHPRVERFNFAERDLARPLRARGIEYWGCPMNSGFRHEPMPVFGERLANIRSWWDRSQRTHAAGMLITSWETSRIAAELTTVIDAAAADLWLEAGPHTPERMLEHGFTRVFGPSRAREAARAALAADRFPFAGYARWEINDRWDIAIGPSGSAPYTRELAGLEALQSRRSALPPPLAASLAFRCYLAARDVFVRRSAEGIFELRHRLERHGPRDSRRRELLDELATRAKRFAGEIRKGRSAAVAMWNRTRDSTAASPNLRQLRHDAKQLHAWQRWLARARKQPRVVWGESPLCGVWQLMFTVHNFAPALQEIVVQEQQKDGSWRDLRCRYAVEFLAAGARPRASLKHDFSVPVADFATPRRVALRGVGQIRIGEVTLVNGAFTIRPRELRHGGSLLLGKPAPKSGLPGTADV